jgi:hypothetical protein
MELVSMSPTAAKPFASEVNQFGNIVDEDTTTVPIGNRWLQSAFATKAYQARHFTFVSTAYDPVKTYYASQTVAPVEYLPPQTVFDHLV